MTSPSPQASPAQPEPTPAAQARERERWLSGAGVGAGRLGRETASLTCLPLVQEEVAQSRVLAPSKSHSSTARCSDPHLLLRPGSGARTPTLGCQGQDGRQQQQVESAHDAPAVAACHLCKSVWARIPRAARGHEPGSAPRSPSPFSTLELTVPASPSPPVASRCSEPAETDSPPPPPDASKPGDWDALGDRSFRIQGTKKATSLSWRG